MTTTTTNRMHLGATILAFTRRAATWTVCAALFAGARAAAGAVQPADVEKPAESPAAATTLLEQLNRETQALYRDVQRGVVRVQLPQPQWVRNVNIAPRGNLLQKWKDLDPEMRRRLEEQQRQQHADTAGPNPGPATEPVAHDDRTVPPTSRPTASDVGPRIGNKGTYIIVPAPAEPRQQQQELQQQQAPAEPLEGNTGETGNAGGSVLERPLEMDANKALPAAFTPNNVGLLLDEQGHLLVPLCVERETIGEGGKVQLSAPNGVITEATFVGSDLQTNLTLLRLDKPARFPGKPVAFGESRPADGSLVLYVSPADGSGRLGLWTGGAQDWGVVYTTDGRVAGIARYGQFLNGTACRVIARHLIQYGSVKRATLGVHITEIRKDDPLRRQLPVLGTRTAMLVRQVMPGSAAERAGLKENDLLLALAGEKVSDLPSLAAAIAARDGETTLKVLRDGRTLEITVDLEQK
jgi:hypothetical protein